MNKFGDMILSVPETRALRRLLAQHIAQEDIEQEIALERAEEERNNRYYEALARIARDTARRDGLTTFWRRGQAQASWETFCASESYHSPLDVDEYWQPDEDWYQTWELNYDSELEAMKREAKV